MNLHDIRSNDLSLLMEYMRFSFPDPWEWKYENDTISFTSNRYERAIRWNTMTPNLIADYSERARVWRGQGNIRENPLNV